MPFTAAGKNKMLDALGATHVAAFQGDPTAAGTELDRVAISWNAASAGNLDSSTAPVLNIQAGETVNYIAFFDASTAGNLLAYMAVTAEGPYGANGTYTLTDADLTIND